MKRLNAVDHAVGLARKNGIELALKIAKRSAVNSHLSMESHLPNPEKGGTNIFFPRDRNGRGAKTAVRERARTHGFWTQVVGVLNKMSTKKG